VPPPVFDPRTIQPVTSRYTDWALTDLYKHLILQCMAWRLTGPAARSRLAFYFHPAGSLSLRQLFRCTSEKEEHKQAWRPRAGATRRWRRVTTPQCFRCYGRRGCFVFWRINTNPRGGTKLQDAASLALPLAEQDEGQDAEYWWQKRVLVPLWTWGKGKRGKKEGFFYPTRWDFRNRIACWKVPRPRPFVLVRATCRRRVWNAREN
jgi:hypothetical protein